LASGEKKVGRMMADFCEREERRLRNEEVGRARGRGEKGSRSREK